MNEKTITQGKWCREPLVWLNGLDIRKDAYSALVLNQKTRMTAYPDGDVFRFKIHDRKLSRQFGKSEVLLVKSMTAYSTIRDAMNAAIRWMNGDSNEGELIYG